MTTYYYDGIIYIPHRYDVPGIELSLTQFEESDADIMEIDWKACGYSRSENARTAYSGVIAKTNRKSHMKVVTRKNKIYICKGDFKKCL